MGNQRVATNALIETSGGVANRPQFSTQRLAPSTGSVAVAVPVSSQLVAVDYQTTTYTAPGLANGAWASATWPSVGFTGLLSANQRYYSSSPQTTGSGTSTVANNTVPLVVGQSTQLCLLCSVASVITSAAGVYVSQVNIKTLGTENQINQVLTGPWFASGTSYLAFSCTPSAGVYNNSGGAFSGTVTLGITAQLFAIFVQ